MNSNHFDENNDGDVDDEVRKWQIGGQFVLNVSDHDRVVEVIVVAPNIKGLVEVGPAEWAHEHSDQECEQHNGQ